MVDHVPAMRYNCRSLRAGTLSVYACKYNREMEGLSILDIINRIMKFKIHYDEHIERVVVIEAESIEDAEEMIDELDHSQSAIIDTTYEVWAIHELPKNPKPYADRV